MDIPPKEDPFYTLAERITSAELGARIRMSQSGDNEGEEETAMIDPPITS